MKCAFQRAINSKECSCKLFESEHLKSIPDALESLISEKRLLQAAALLVRSLKTINKPEMLEIPAVSDLRSYLVSQEKVCSFFERQWPWLNNKFA